MKISYLIALVFALGIVSCKDDKEEIIDTGEKPSIEFTSHEADAQVWNKITIKTKTTDDNAIEKVEFYAKGLLVETVSTEPFGFILNTKDYADGALEIKAKAFNKAGNSSEASISLEVFNTLMTFAVPENYFNNNKGFIYLSDEEGKVLATEPLENGKTAVLVRPDDFEGTKFSTSLVRESGNNLFISTYPDVEMGARGGYPEVQKKSLLGTFKLNFDQQLSDHSAYMTMANPSDYLRLTEFCGGCSVDISLYKDPTDILLVAEPYSYLDEIIPSYIFLEDVAVNDEVAFTPSALKPMTAKNISLSTTFDSGLTDLFALANGGGSYRVSGQWLGTEFSDIHFFYPELDFSGYRTHYFITKGDRTYSATYFNEEISTFVLPEFNFNVTRQSNILIEATTDGDYDYYGAGWVYSGIDRSVYYDVYGPKSDKASVKRHLLPQEILKAFPFIDERKFEPYDFSVNDYDGATTFEEYRDQFLGINTESSNQMNSQSVLEYFDESSESGRVIRNLKSEYELFQLRNKF